MTRRWMLKSEDFSPIFLVHSLMPCLQRHGIFFGRLMLTATAIAMQAHTQGQRLQLALPCIKADLPTYIGLVADRQAAH